MIIKKCRNCHSKRFSKILDLGNQYFTGYFPSKNQRVPKGNLQLILCNKCKLVQLKHNFDLNKLYGKNYGYRSSLNKSMVAHLKKKQKFLIKKYKIKKEDYVLDIGSNDGTFLNFFENYQNLYGIDPTIMKFGKYYNKGINKISDFFSSYRLKKKTNKKFKLITSMSMFYDLKQPNLFIRDIKNSLSENGIWHFEQSYLPLMIKTLSFDTICHEHLEYYSFAIVNKMLNQNGMKILNVKFNSINGGSFEIYSTKKNTNLYKVDKKNINRILKKEKSEGFENLDVYRNFSKKIEKHKLKLKSLLNSIKQKNKKIFGYGASTKGNVLLQYYKIDNSTLDGIFEVNENKFGKFTPGTKIPIIDEKKLYKIKPDYLLVLPWHFKNFFIKKLKNKLPSKTKFIFPLPKVSIV
tara:strand:+ start:679 stop:1899 length:1221 start_codon:yes stop_codon:yes gene_type:complete